MLAHLWTNLKISSLRKDEISRESLFLFASRLADPVRKSVPENVSKYPAEAQTRTPHRNYPSISRRDKRRLVDRVPRVDFKPGTKISINRLSPTSGRLRPSREPEQQSCYALRIHSDTHTYTQTHKYIHTVLCSLTLRFPTPVYAGNFRGEIPTEPFPVVSGKIVRVK